MPASVAASDLQVVELALRELAVAQDGGEVILHLAYDVDRLPQPLARIGVARRRLPPGRDVVGVEPGEGLLQELVVSSSLARAPRTMAAPACPPPLPGRSRGQARGQDYRS